MDIGMLRAFSVKVKIRLLIMDYSIFHLNLSEVFMAVPGFPPSDRRNRDCERSVILSRALLRAGRTVGIMVVDGSPGCGGDPGRRI